jgi:hypothetical protein
MGDKFRDILEEAAKEAAKSEPKEATPKKGKMLKQLHALDDTIEDFIDKVEDEIMSIEDNPVFVKKAHQLLADMSKEYSEFILALRSIVNAVDRKEKILPAFEKQESRVRDVLDGQGNGPMDNGEEDAPPEGEDAPPEGKDDGDEYELKVARKGGKKKKSPVKEALMMGEGKYAGFPKKLLMNKFYDFDDVFVGIEWNTLGYGDQYSIIKKAMTQIDKALRSIK